MEGNIKHLLKGDGSVKDALRTEAKLLDMWTPYKELYRIVEQCITKGDESSYCALQVVLRKYRQNFLNLMKNLPKNSKSRDTVVKGVTEGINIPQLHFHSLPKDIVEEVIVLSDMYNMDELVALNLLTTAQNQMPSYPGLARGLVAVLLYYDGHKTLAMTLKAIMEARYGLHWEVGISAGVSELLASFSDDLVQDGLLETIMEWLKNADVSKEIDMLSSNKGLGGVKHHHMVATLFEEIRQTLADIVFLYSAQAGLRHRQVTTLLEHLRSIKPPEDTPATAKGIDNVTLTLHMAFLFATDVNVQLKEDTADMVRGIPLLSEEGLIGSLIKDLQSEDKPWSSVGLQAISCFSLSVTLRSLRSVSRLPLHKDEEDGLIAFALKENVFGYMYSRYLQSEMIRKEEFYQRRLHNLITDFIVLMPFKVAELQTQAIEVCRMMAMYTQQGIAPPENLPRHFEMLLMCFTRLYGSDPLNLKLHMDYWFDEGIKLYSGSFKSVPYRISLFKFLCATGVTLPSALFLTFLHLLGSLILCQESARQAFRYFKQNPCDMLTWNHFFKSFQRYYDSLLVEQPAAIDMMYYSSNVSRPTYSREILPIELQGLKAVLAIIRHVAEHDESSRMTLYENKEWKLVDTFVGLLISPVNIYLKQELVLTLAAFCKSTEAANVICAHLETYQLITSAPTISVYSRPNFQRELEEVENVMGEYPLTKAVLKLLNGLAKPPEVVAPFDIHSSKSRSMSNFNESYLNYVMRSIILPLESRPYKNISEKWEVADLCLKLFLKLLNQYEPNVSDFAVERVSETQSTHPPAGFHIMIDLLSGRELFHILVSVIDEGCKLAETYKPYDGKETYEGLSLTCLRFVEKALELQVDFTKALRSSEADIILTPFSTLLQGINPKSNMPDHLLNITKYVTYNQWLPEHSLTAVNILYLAITHRINHSVLLTFLTSSSSLETDIRHGFVECLESESSDWNEDGSMSIAAKTKVAIMQLLLLCSNSPSPNIAHFLFGFNLKNVKKTIFQQPGINAFPRTCLHSVLQLLSTCLLLRRSNVLSPSNVCPKLIILAYKTLNAFCEDPVTYDSILRFLRSSQNLLQQHLLHLHVPFSSFSPFDKFTELECSSLLLNMIAIELRTLDSIGQTAKLEELSATLLTDINIKYNISSRDTTTECVEGRRTKLQSTAERDQQRLPAAVINCRLYQFVKGIPFALSEPQMPAFQFFSPACISQLVQMCEMENALREISTSKLQSILVKEVSSTIGEAASVAQRQHMFNEIKEVISYAEELNKHRKSLRSIVNFFDAWKKLVAVFFIVVPKSVIPFRERFSLQMELILFLSQAVVENLPVLRDIGVITSEILLLLLTNARKAYLMEMRHSFGEDDESKNRARSFFRTFENYITQSITYLIHWILNTNVSVQKVRINLYSSLLTYMHLYLDHTESTSEDEREEKGNTEAIERNASKLVLQATLSDRLVNVLCNDAVNTTNICQMLALSCLSMAVEVDSRWISLIASKGYLKCLIRSIKDSDSKLSNVVLTDAASLSQLYIFESKMKFLCKIASHASGAELIVEEKVFSCLAAMDVFNNHPSTIVTRSIDVTSDASWEHESKYLELITPVLSLCKCVLLSLGTKRGELLTELAKILFAHNEMVSMVLKSSSPHLDPKFLKELADVTYVTSFILSEGALEVRGEVAEIGLSVEKLKQLLLSVMVHLDMSEAVTNQIIEKSKIIDDQNTSYSYSYTVVNTYLQVIRNCYLYMERVVMVESNKQPLLQPHTFHVTKPTRESSIVNTASVGTVLKHLTDAVTFYLREYDDICKLNSKLAENGATRINIHGSMATAEERRQFKDMEQIRVKKLIVEKSETLDICYFIIESALYAIETHLYHYTLPQAPLPLPAKTTSTVVNRDSKEGQLSNWKLSIEQLKQLQEGVALVFHDAFIEQLATITKEKSLLEKTYMQTVIHRIKKLLKCAQPSVTVE